MFTLSKPETQVSWGLIMYYWELTLEPHLNNTLKQLSDLGQIRRSDFCSQNSAQTPSLWKRLCAMGAILHCQETLLEDTWGVPSSSSSSQPGVGCRAPSQRSLPRTGLLHQDQQTTYLPRRLPGGPGVLLQQSAFPPFPQGLSPTAPPPVWVPLSLCAWTSSCTGRHSFHQLSQPFPAQSQSASHGNRHWAPIWRHSPKGPASYLGAGGLQHRLPSWKRRHAGKDTHSKHGFALPSFPRPPGRELHSPSPWRSP